MSFAMPSRYASIVHPRATAHVSGFDVSSPTVTWDALVATTQSPQGPASAGLDPTCMPSTS
jgi:hypothetical protein